MIELIGKLVEVVSRETTYTGTLVEMNDKELYLQTEMGWLVLPIDNVLAVNEKEVIEFNANPPEKTEQE